MKYTDPYFEELQRQKFKRSLGFLIIIASIIFLWTSFNWKLVMGVWLYFVGHSFWYHNDNSTPYDPYKN